ncbi:MAG: Transcriptional regulator, XRE family [Candidatus Uhrbacteria bacterium GW2011_GWF2_41_16]|jgi:transcriptional regulator with XRE-family HTH domain|uniref:Transcriptional regulator, XRE family n=2 Tax=Candidatus Uhriibacteriota TaxID=1752732 RepID=A0A0G0VFE8_9BACT|nr:MAG: Transcriptional regulator, XRE family [Candidatus Uhrbacteria bacterium GW2011_GWC2_41_11]KKR98366.1 MAG: Transcriptional regulator, XRE family [Candidatus Uhrbacteria bacterium GW2011_GWF2_41_16]HBO99569.1 hypothetical protein [Candidatus Uhrbacteria bacterium]
MGFVVKNLKNIETFGDRLRSLRHDSNYTLDQVAEETKIQRRYLQAFESNRFCDLPEPVYARHFLKTYVKQLGGDPSYFLARFEKERGTCDLVHSLRLPRKKIRARQFLVSYHVWQAGIGLLLFTAFMGYIGSHIRTLLEPPAITIFEPNDNLSTEEAIVTVRGKTEPGVELAVNGKKILPEPDGSFATEIALERGMNMVTVEGVTKHSRKTAVYRRVVLEQETPQKYSSALSTSRL